MGLSVQEKVLSGLIYKSPQYCQPSFDSIAISVQEGKFKINFHDGGRGGHLGFPIETILAIFDLQVTLILPTKFWVNGPFGSGKDAQNGFFCF